MGSFREMGSDSRKNPGRQGGWLPDGTAELESWLEGHRDRADLRGGDRDLHPSVRALQQLIERDPVLRMYATRMIEEEPQAKGYSAQPLESVEQMLVLIDEVLTLAPEWGKQMVATPLGAVLDWTMGTPSGFAFYRDPRVNEAIRDILNAWSAFLDGPDSLVVLNDSPTGWMSEDASRAIGMEQFVHDPDDQYWGFSSWNDFFTRRFTPGARSVASPTDDKVIVSACESTPYGISTDVQRRDRFWIKSQPYSLQDMLADDESVDEFVGGTVYQAFLSPTDYHRWHSPVSGRVVRAVVLPGTYFSEADTQGVNAAEPTYSQAYLAHVATRAVIEIEADNGTIGRVAVVLIGMSDVSSCVLAPDLVAGVHVDKGDEIGWFQYGGSSNCIAFRPGVIADFALNAVPQGDSGRAKVQVRSRLARAVA